MHVVLSICGHNSSPVALSFPPKVIPPCLKSTGIKGGRVMLMGRKGMDMKRGMGRWQSRRKNGKRGKVGGGKCDRVNGDKCVQFLGGS